jgi:hypothetical protein
MKEFQGGRQQHAPDAGKQARYAAAKWCVASWMRSRSPDDKRIAARVSFDSRRGRHRPPDTGEETMTTKGLRRAPVSACISAVAGICLSAAALAELPTEQVTIAPPLTAKNRAYVSDIAINHIADGKLHVIVTPTPATTSGVIGSGFTGQVTPLPGRQRDHPGHRLSVPRPARRRTDIVEVWDAGTRWHSTRTRLRRSARWHLNYRGLIRTSADGRWSSCRTPRPLPR